MKSISFTLLFLALSVLMYSQAPDAFKEKVSEKIDISHLAEGLYIVKLIEPGRILLNNFVKTQ